MSAIKGRAKTFLKKAVASVCSLAMAAALVPAVASVAYADEEGDAVALTVSVYNEYSGATTVAKTYTSAELENLANTTQLTYAYAGKSGDTTVTTSKYVKIADLLAGVNGWCEGATWNFSDRTKGDAFTYADVTEPRYYQNAEAPAVLALTAEKDGTAIDNAPMSCIGTADGTNAQGNQFWTGVADIVITNGFNVGTYNEFTGATTVTKTYTQAALLKMAEANTEMLTYAYAGKSGDTTVTTSSYVKLADIMADAVDWQEGMECNIPDRTKGDAFTYEQITGELHYGAAAAPAVLALTAEKDGTAIDNAPMTCFGTADGTNAVGNQFWTGATSLNVIEGITVRANDVQHAKTTLMKNYSKAALEEMAAADTTQLTYAYAGKSGDTTVTTSSYVKIADMLSGLSGWGEGSTWNFDYRTKGDAFTYADVTEARYFGTAAAPAIIALAAEKDGTAIDNAPMSCIGTADGTNAVGNQFWTGVTGITYTVTHNQNFTITYGSTTIKAGAPIKDGFTYTAWVEDETGQFVPQTLKYDLYNVTIPYGTASVTLNLPEECLVYNYDADGNYLAGWVTDYTAGSKSVNLKVDANNDGKGDYIYVQAPYNADYTGGGMIYAIHLTIAAAPVVKTVSTVTLNKATVTAKMIKAAAKKGAKTIVLGAKVKKIAKNAFKGCTKITKIIVKSKKLTKKRVKNSLKSSKVKYVKVKVSSKKKTNAKYVKKYKKIFTKKNCGKKVKVYK